MDIRINLIAWFTSVTHLRAGGRSSEPVSSRSNVLNTSFLLRRQPWSKEMQTPKISSTLELNSSILLMETEDLRSSARLFHFSSLFALVCFCLVELLMRSLLVVLDFFGRGGNSLARGGNSLASWRVWTTKLNTTPR